MWTDDSYEREPYPHARRFLLLVGGLVVAALVRGGCYYVLG